MSLKELKELIAKAGLNVDGCIEKPDIRQRAREAMAALAARPPAPPRDERERAQALRHLSSNTFTELKPSERDGIGVFAIKRIPAGVEMFRTNGPPSGATIDLQTEDFDKLPAHVVDQIRKFAVPHCEQEGGDLRYGLPNAGLNALNISWYLNSDVTQPNVEFGDERDESGFTKVIATRDIEVGEELFLGYDLPNTGRTRGTFGEDGNTAVPLTETRTCRICQEEILPNEEGAVDIKCVCASRWLHQECCSTWFASKLQIRLAQQATQEQVPGRPHVENRWTPSCHVSCEVCAHELPGTFVSELLDQVADARKGGIAERLQEVMGEGEAVKVSMGAADPTEEGPNGRTRRANTAGNGMKGKGTTRVPSTPMRATSTPMRMLGDRKLRSATSSATSAGEPSNKTAFGVWKRNTKVKIWMKEDAEWVDGKVVKHVSATDRMHLVRQQNGGSIDKMPKFQRGMYLVRWKGKDDRGRNFEGKANFDEDYVSDGDATVKEA